MLKRNKGIIIESYYNEATQHKYGIYVIMYT